MPNRFVYQTFRVYDDHQTVSFDYELIRDGQTYSFSESLNFPVLLKASDQQRAALRALHLALGISYYKTFLPPTVEHAYAMDESEAIFWNSVWQNGLGEFLYINHLPPSRLAAFVPQEGASYPTAPVEAQTNGRALLGIGGGKDSILAGELLKSIALPVEGFVMATGEQLGQAKAVAETMGIPLHAVKRTLDKRLLEVQELPGAYKGHVPISLIFGLVGTALAIATDSTYVVVANESSASIPRHTNKHGEINHQWSKSLEAEKMLQTFVHTHIAPDVTYFSAIRGLTSVAVAKLFAHYPQYFEIFTSDNFVFRIDPDKRPDARWSLESPKSLSSFILLAPWLSEPDMLRIFGRNFLDEPALETLFWEMTGQQGEPPLDCVGTVDELVLSLNFASQQTKFVTSRLMNLAREHNVIVDSDWDSRLNAMLQLQPDVALPEALRQKISDKLSQELTA